MRAVKRIGLVAGGAAVMFLSVACNESPTAESVRMEQDWIHNTTPDPVETPTPSASPRPTQSPVPQPSPTPTVTSTPRGIDLYTGPTSVEKYVLKFIDDAKIQGVDVSRQMKSPKLEIRIASLDSYGSSTIGLCETGGIRRVTFDPDFWNSVSETQRELLAHHELGHCVLYRPHRSTLLTSGAYASVMYPTIMSSTTYNNNYDHYQEELFTYGSSALSMRALSDATQTHICNGVNE